MPAPRLLTLGLAGFVVLGVAATAVVVSTNQPETCSVVDQEAPAASLVTVTDVDETPVPDAFFPTPLKTSGIERVTLIEGDGDGAVTGSTVDFQVAVYFGGTNEFITSSSYRDDEPVRRIVDGGSEDFFSSQLACAKTGERVVFTSTVQDVFGEIPEDDVIKNASTVVVVVDVAQTYMPRPTGRANLPERGLPQVVDHPDGFHGLSFPMSPVPEALRFQTVIPGDGAPVTDGDRLVVHYTGVVWQTQSVFASSFDQLFPVTLDLIDGTIDGASAGVISGVYESLVGQRIGSRVLAVLPPEWGYPAGNQPPGVPDGATLVYVFDILGVE